MPVPLMHKASPTEGRETHCVICGQQIKQVPGGQGTTHVHVDTGAVAAPNPPINLDHIHVLLDVLNIAQDHVSTDQPWRGYDGDPDDDPKLTEAGWLRTRDEARAILQAQLSVL